MSWLRNKALWAVVAGVLVAGGAGLVWHKHRPEQAPAAVLASSNEPFAVGPCSVRDFEDSQALSVSFTQPLDRDQSFDELLQVTDLGATDGSSSKSHESPSTAPAGGKNADPNSKILQGGWVITDNPRVIVFPNIPSQHKFRIKLAKGIKAANGDVISAGTECQLATERIAPSFFFASRGVVLPAKQNGGLPVVTTNVPEVDIQFLRVQDDQLPRFIEQVTGTQEKKSSDNEDSDEGYSDDYYYDSESKLQGNVAGWQLDKLKTMSDSVYLGRFLTDDKADRRHTTFIPVENIKELQEPGIYVAVMSQPGRFSEAYQVTYFYVSDIGLHVHRRDAQTDIFTTSLTSGKALSGINIELLDGSAKRLAKVATDGDGHAVVKGVPSSARVLLARREKEISLVALREPALDLSEFDIGGYLSRNNKLFVYAGRDLYRPGENFNLSMLARNPDGRIVSPAPVQLIVKRPDGKAVQTFTWQADARIPGYFQRTISLPADAPTGNWNIEVRADPGAKAADTVWPFRVEEFLPERMKLDLRTAKPYLNPGDEFVVNVQGDYLFGAPAAGNRLLASVATARSRNPLPQKWPGFIFGDFADDSIHRRQELEESSLDDKGHAEVSVPLDAGSAHSPLSIKASFSLLESGGRPVVRSVDQIWWPAEAMLAVRPLFDRDVARENAPAGFELIRVKPDGSFAPLDQAKVRLVREDKQYYWRFDDQRGWHSGYSENEELLDNGTVSLKQRAQLTVPVKWGTYRLEVEDPQTGQVLRYRFYAGWNAQDADAMGNRPDRVQLKLDGVPVKPGKDFGVTLVPPHDGEALVLLEGDKVLWSKRVSVSTSGTRISIPVDPAWQRHDLYVSVIAFRPGSQGDRVTPARAVGLAHVPLDSADRKLQVALTAPDKALPEHKTLVKVKVLDSQGKVPAKQAMVTISAVDVGILNITRYQSPDPFDFFFGKHRYETEMLDMYGKLIEKMDGTQGKLKWGGDAGKRDSQSMPKKVKLVDLFSGPVILDAKGEAQIPLNLPDFNGTLRLMAVAATPDSFGKAEREMTVAAPIVAELAMPRFITPGDAATLALDVTNLSGAAQTVKLKLEGADPVRIADGERTVTLQNKQRSTLRFNVEATDAYGLGRIRLNLRSEGAKPIEIHREAALQVQPPVPMERDIQRLKLDAGAVYKLDPNLLARYYKGSAQVSVTVSNRPPLNVNSLVKGLLDYPYGCAEQTTSAAYPHLFIDEAGATAMGLKPHSREERARFVDGAIGRLAGMQGSLGGFSLWGSGGYEYWLTAYVSGFLQDARDNGFNVPDAMMKRANDWMLSQVQNAPNYIPTVPEAVKPDKDGHYNYRDYELLRNAHQRFADMAYMAYILARQQKAPLASLRLLHDRYRDRAKSPLPLIHLALALDMMGDKARAKVALDEAMKKPYGINTGYGWEWLGDYGSRTRDLAMSYALLERHKINHPRKENLLFDLVDQMGGRGYFSTQERLALYLAARASGGNPGAEWTVLFKTAKGTQAMSSKTTGTQSFTAKDLAQGIALENSGKEKLFVAVETNGYPLQIPADKRDVVELSRTYYEPNGSVWNGRPLKVGETLVVEVQAKAKQLIKDGLIVDRIPAGFEVENLNLSQGEGPGAIQIRGSNLAALMEDERISHREFRDDRFVAAARLDGNLNVYYMIRVVTPGRFVVPPVYAEDMYRPELTGIGIAQPEQITIVDPTSKGTELLEAK